MEPIIQFRDFSFQYFSQAEPTLRGIGLDIFPGEKILIVGPSGSGKSTLGHCLNGLIPFSYKGEISGSLRIAGQDTRELNIFSLSKMVGTVLQDPDGQFVGLSVAEDIAFALENDCVPLPKMRARVQKVAKMVDMHELLGSSPFELSGGQKQRTALAGVMIDDVDILLFDEPLANLDPATGKAAIEIIDDIHQQTGKTIIIIEHRLEDVLHRPVDRIIVVDGGRIVADMPPDELLCTGLLRSTGIREPLYITALGYAGVETLPEMRPARIETLDIAGREEQVRRWQRAVPAAASEPEQPSLLRLENVSFSYGPERQILKNISVDIRSGEMLSIIGKNGAGKSTLTKLICGFEKPDAGRILLSGDDISGKTIRERAETIGLVMQNPNQMLSLPMIADEVGLGLKLRGRTPGEIKDRTESALEVCGLLPFRSWPVSALSFGQKKRVTVAAMLALDPAILLLDEPTAGQDYRHYTEIMEFLSQLNKSGVAIVLITHDMHLMLEYTRRAVVLADGEMIADCSSARALTDADIIRRANLKETSLYSLAELAGIGDATGFVESFIDWEKLVKNR